MDQCLGLTELRRDPAFSIYAAIMQRYALQRVDRAYRSFFSRGGFPRFKSRDRYNSIGWEQRNGWRLNGGKFIAKGLGAIRVQSNRAMPDKIRAVRIKREGRHWFISFMCDVESAHANNNSSIGIDMGISTLAAMSNGEMIENPRFSKRAQPKIRRHQRALARCRKGSNRRRKIRERLACAHRKVRRQRETHLHQVSATLTTRFGTIAIEKLNVKGLSKGILARSVNDASWGRFITMLRYKAERAGGVVIAVDPKGTSQTCPACGQIKAKELAERVHSCECGCVMDRDVAAAKIIHMRAVRGPQGANVGGYAKRGPGKAAA